MNNFLLTQPATLGDVMSTLELGNLTKIHRTHEVATQTADMIVLSKAMLDAGLFCYRIYVMRK